MCKWKECRLQSLGFEHSDPRLFATSQWPLPSLLYVVYRALVACFFVIATILSGLICLDWAEHRHDRVKWFIWLTHWSFTALTVSTLLRAACAFHGHVTYSRLRPETRNNYAPMPLLYKVSWLFYNVSTAAALMVTILFWTFTYPKFHDCPKAEVLINCDSPCTRTCAEPEPPCFKLNQTCSVERRCQCPGDQPYWHDAKCFKEGECPVLDANSTVLPYSKTTIIEVDAMDVITHAVNSACVLLDVWLTAMPVRLLHCLQYCVYIAAYAIFTLVYYLAGGTNGYHKHYIYSGLDWKEPGLTIGSFIGLIVLGVILWTVFWCLVQLRLYIFRKCVTSELSGSTREHELFLSNRQGTASRNYVPGGPQIE